MTTREYQEAYDDDSENVREWQPRTALESLAGQGISDSSPSAQDAQEPPEGLSEYAYHLRAEIDHAWRHVDEAVSERDEARTERDAALAALARVEALADQWEHTSTSNPAARLLQALDEAALEYPRGPVG